MSGAVDYSHDPSMMGGQEHKKSITFDLLPSQESYAFGFRNRLIRTLAL
ncbi:MAG: hypothetical protein RL693_1628 [Verrucomicrobiota bacterium]|jgi:hypothetical protein